MSLNQIVKQFFVENQFDQLAQRISVVRNDGVIVFSNTTDFNESYSIGALVGGLWQAAETLNSIVTKGSDVLDFRLGFDTSDSGIYVLPLEINKTNYYICAIYKDICNPAVLKKSLRNLKDTLSFYLREVSMQSSPISRRGYLFENITDEEMDKLFKYAEI